MKFPIYLFIALALGVIGVTLFSLFAKSFIWLMIPIAIILGWSAANLDLRRGSWQ